jgi:hypothetical protein
MQAYIKDKGYVPFQTSQLSFVDEVRLTNTEGWKINLNYEDSKTWSLCIPKFDTTRVAVKDNRYFLRTKYFRALDCVNSLASTAANYIYKNRERFGVTYSEEEITNMLKKDLFVARTLHANAFYDSETGKNIDLDTVTSRFRVKCYIKPVVYVFPQKCYIDLEVSRATIFRMIEKKEDNKKVYKEKKTVASNSA